MLRKKAIALEFEDKLMGLSDTDFYASSFAFKPAVDKLNPWKCGSLGATECRRFTRPSRNGGHKAEQSACERRHEYRDEKPAVHRCRSDQSRSCREHFAGGLGEKLGKLFL